MTTLLELKEKLIRFYGKNEIYVETGDPVCTCIVYIPCDQQQYWIYETGQQDSGCSHSCTCVFHASGQ